MPGHRCARLREASILHISANARTSVTTGTQDFGGVEARPEQGDNLCGAVAGLSAIQYLLRAGYPQLLLVCSYTLHILYEVIDIDIMPSFLVLCE